MRYLKRIVRNRQAGHLKSADQMILFIVDSLLTTQLTLAAIGFPLTLIEYSI